VFDAFGVEGFGDGGPGEVFFDAETLDFVVVWVLFYLAPTPAFVLGEFGYVRCGN